jgi:ABC-2 type transport system ATP-binding protein
MIKTHELTRHYGDLTAVDHVSFEIGKGEIVGLLGHNGAGKTTIMKMLTGYLEPSSGQIEIDGLDIEAQRTEAQQRIGYLPENCPLYPEMAVIDFLAYAAQLHGLPLSRRAGAVREAIARTELDSKATQPIGTLSRGYRQRVGVAQAILHEPRILILDEPTNGLDPGQIRHMRGLITDLAQQATVIISTHIMQEVNAICDRVLIIRNGRKVLDAQLRTLKNAHRLITVVDQPPEQTRPRLAAVAGVSGVEVIPSDDGRYHYALDLECDSAEVAPPVAASLLQQGARLFALYPEQRDLETLFNKINQGEDVVHE